jgi:hypothetical protein
MFRLRDMKVMEKKRAVKQVKAVDLKRKRQMTR